MKNTFLKRLVPAVLMVFAAGDLLAKPALVVLEYRDRTTSATETSKIADRIREEFRRRLGGAVLTKQETEDLFYYHKKGALQGRGRMASTWLEEGKRAYFDLQLSEAQQSFEKILRLPPETAEEMQLPARLLQGLTFMAENDRDQARTAFVEALRLNPDVVLDPSYFPPKVVAYFRQVAAETPRVSVPVTIEAFPEGAEVRVNGILKGLAPLTLHVSAGRQVISLSASHYGRWTKTVDLREGEPKSLRVRLPWQKGEPSRFLGISGSESDAAGGLASVGSEIGELLGVGKVLFVSYSAQGGPGQVTTRLVDVPLQAAHKETVVPAAHIGENSAAVAGEVADRVAAQIREALGEKPDQFAESRFKGDIILIGHHRKPFYKKPLFWIMVGAAGAGGGVAAALAGGGAAVGAIGVIF